MKNCNDENKCGGRREFLVKASAIAGGIALSLSGLNASQAQTEMKKDGDTMTDDLVLKLDAASPLNKIGGSQVFDTKSGKIVVIRNAEMNFTAFSTKCTHKGGPVNYDEKTKQLVCEWHGSQFNPADGSVVKGPAKLPLPSFSTDEAVVVSLKPKA
jgi:cytochrome b6-f complex iron-sulfur subunit